MEASQKKDKSINDNNNYSAADKEEILSEINSLKNELESKKNLINSLISEVNKQNLALKDFEILQKTKNNMNSYLMKSKEEIENLKSMNSTMKKELEKVKSEKEECEKQINILNSQLNSEKKKTLT